MTFTFHHCTIHGPPLLPSIVKKVHPNGFVERLSYAPCHNIIATCATPSIAARLTHLLNLHGLTDLIEPPTDPYSKQS